MEQYLCCDDKPQRRSYMEACCGSKVYHAHTHTCCAGFLNTGLGESKSECCGRYAYPKGNVTCQSDGKAVGQCAGVDFDLTKRRCCNHNLYNIRKYFRCCGSRYVKLSGPNLTQLKRIACVDDVVKWNVRYCAKVPYVPSKKLCCQNKIYTKRKRHACCKNSYHDTKNYRCMAGSVIPKIKNGKHVGKCGNDLFSTKRQVCCLAMLYSKRRHFKCCGSRYFEESSRVTCEDGEIVHSTPMLGRRCRKHNRKTQVCCDGRVYAQLKGSECCGNSYIDTEISLCNGAKPALKEGVATCGKTQYVEGVSHCCEKRLYRKRVGFRCCAKYYYNPNYIFQCRKGVLKRNVNKCANKRFSRKTSICCRNRNTKKEKVYKKYASKRCCKEVYYSKKQYACIAGKIIGFDSSDGSSSEVRKPKRGKGNAKDSDGEEDKSSKPSKPKKKKGKGKNKRKN